MAPPHQSGRDARSSRLSFDEALVNHLVLPVQLPQRQDLDIEGVESALVEHLVQATKQMRDLPDNQNQAIWDSISRSLASCRSFITSGGRLERSSLLTELRHVAQSDFLLLHIRSQNAAVFIQRSPDLRDTVVFEVFEASPRCAEVLAAENALEWDFPGSAVAVPLSVFNDETFLTNLSSFFEQASVESTKNFSAHTIKAGSTIAETRDTADPSLVTSMLVAILEANGQKINTKILRKRVRDDVCWENAEMPWRRLPLWLVTRVAIQRYLSLQLKDDHGRIEYKFFVCLVLTKLMNKILLTTSMERLSQIKAKLCRRLAKLETDVNHVTTTKGTCDYLFAQLGPIFKQDIEQACEHITRTWERFKVVTTRQIPQLPKRADKGETRLSLRISLPHLTEAMTRFRTTTLRSRLVFDDRKGRDPQAHLKTFPEPYFKLNKKEAILRQFCSAKMNDSLQDSSGSTDGRCVKIARIIRKYLDEVATYYDKNAHQKSLMLLTVMELWVCLDEAACTEYHLLRKFHPGFHPRMMEVLHLTKLSDMERLQAIQDYLKGRVDKCDEKGLSIFADPCSGCFAERFFDSSEHSAALHALQERIESNAALDRKHKLLEWQTKSREFEKLTQAIDGSSCVYITDDNNPLGRVFHDRRCPRCQLQRQADRMKIAIFEDPLPSDTRMKKVAVFELGGFRSFETYRDCTWHLLSRLACATREESFPPKCTIRTYSELSNFSTNSISSFVLASTTKSFLNTHYAQVHFPVDWDSVCRANGLKYAYFDEESMTWPGRMRHFFSFAHHCALLIPASSPLQPLPTNGNSGPSSYEIMASQGSCPSGVSVHEVAAFQTLMSGTRRRWIALLVELGSSNLNFSTEATAILVGHLISECGPARDDGNPLRVMHDVFLDESFCQKLTEQLSQRLDTVVTNWREVYLMDTLLTLILRMYSLAPTTSTASVDSLMLLQRARNITAQWMKLLREETRVAKDSSVAKRCQMYTIWAAVLCKRTFASHAESSELLDGPSLATFIECCITLHSNLNSEPLALPQLLSAAVVMDFKIMHQVQDILCCSMVAYPEAFLIALASVWPEPEGVTRQVHDTEIDEASCWVTAIVDAADDFCHTQTVKYNYLHGLLLVDGMPVGQLPQEYQNDPTLKDLFGEQSLLTYPSSMNGMTYSLNIVENGYQFHIGFHEGAMIIRACKEQTILELMPQKCFGSPNCFDLPAALVEEQFHWLNLRTGVLEIRPKSRPWISTPSNWTLRVRPGEWNSSGECVRARGTAITDYLVDPHTPLFHRLARIFEHFEPRHLITVYQRTSNRRSLFVELRRLQLTFVVNQNRRLFAYQLRAEIDIDQDAGTWYGLQSKLVLKQAEGHGNQRMILVPLGPLRAKREGQHVITTVDSTGDYGKFTINSILGRIDCAAEPSLIYRKAEVHGYTSSVVPDPLTMKTGTEEALAWLSSGICQPWIPLSPGATGMLHSCARLSPSRRYYPEDMKVMKTDIWDPNLTPMQQHEGFRGLVGRIIAKADQLGKFDSQPQDALTLPPQPPGSEVLNLRAWFRRQSLLRPHPCIQPATEPKDRVYDARDRSSSSKMRYANVLETTTLIKTWPTRLRTTRGLARSLSQCSSINGFTEACSKTLLSDRLNIDVRKEWGTLIKFSRERGHDRIALMFLLAPAVFRYDAEMDLIRTIIAFAIFDELRSLSLPPWPQYLHFQPDQLPTVDYLAQLMKPFRTPAPEDDRHTLSDFMSGKELRKMREEKLKHERKSEQDCKDLAEFLLKQWPSAEPSVDGLTGSFLLDIEPALNVIRPEWTRLFHNYEFSNHIKLAQAVLDRRQSDDQFRPTPFVSSADSFPRRIVGGEIPDLTTELLRQAIPEGFSWLKSLGPTSNTPLGFGPVASSYNQPRKASPRAAEQAGAIQELGIIIHDLANTNSIVRRQYARELKQSLQSFVPQAQESKAHSENSGGRNTVVDTRDFHVEVERRFAGLKAALQSPTSSFSERCVFWLQSGLLFPIITPCSLLGHLRSFSRHQYGSGVRESLIQYGISITRLQRKMRLNELALKGNAARYKEEDANKGYVNWRPEEYPDWLLLEIEANLLIRPDQVDVALATISPRSGSNALVQLNMGQGKTSVIVPLVLLVLANGKNLARIVVPKALLQQTGQLLHSRLGGLLNRELCHVPFSRRSPTHLASIHAYRNLHQEMLQKAGIMICLPEHSLSFMLSGQQRLLDKQVNEARAMMHVQNWLRRICHDVLDESDYTLAVRTQLIYPSGDQAVVDGQPHRWIVVESLLKLVDAHLYGLQRSYRHSIDVVRSDEGRYPLMYFLRKDAEENLLQRLTQSILRGAGGILPMANLSSTDLDAIREFVSNVKVKQTAIDRIRRLDPDKGQLRQTIYLLRGLLVNRILMMTLKKRWNVQYGLHPDRDPIAVPFYAKGVPSDQSEWGHPDVAILFTCLAFYYGGLSPKQLRQGLEHVLKSDDPSAEYDRWTQSCRRFPDSLREWNSINLDDEFQLHEIWKAARYSVIVIDHYLNNFVFPRHAKQFKVKLQSNAWDIPVFNPSGTSQASSKNAARPLTTGFSGTNDNRSMLPLNIKQQDLQRLSHTNAEVLTYLLHRRNREYVVIQTADKRRQSEEGFLHMLHARGIRVLVDAGAQILEMDNISLAKKWLQVDHRAPAALYFDKDTGKPWVINRDHRKTPLIASTYADDLHECLVYIDQAHTRGTDLKLPTAARGALTLGLGQTKDHTVQAAMRLRQLATQQSVVFFAPPEVNQSILDLRKKASSIQIDSRDVISWLLSNTTLAIEQMQPLYYSQGIDFCKRMQAAADNPDLWTDDATREKYRAAIRSEEQQTLQQLYEPRTKSRSASIKGMTDPRLAAFARELNKRRLAFQDTGDSVHGSALQEVEQEREVAFEVESVRQVKKPGQYASHSFPGLHRDLETFARTGHLPADSHACRHFLQQMRQSKLGRKFGVSVEASKSRLLISSEFERTIKDASCSASDSFIRPVNWILWSPVAECAIIIIPEEAELILPICRKKRPAATYTYLLTYAAPITRKMLHFNKLNFYTVPVLPEGLQVPEWLSVELGLFGGRLYFDWSEYPSISQFLGIEDCVTADNLGYDGSVDAVAIDGTVSEINGNHEPAQDGDHQVVAKADERSADSSSTTTTTTTTTTLAEDVGEPTGKNTAGANRFASKPLQFLQEWLALRRRGQDFASTPMGHLAQGKALDKDHPFFRKFEIEQPGKLYAPVARRTVAKDDDEVDDGPDDIICTKEDGESDGGDSDVEIEYNEDEMYSSGEEEPEPEPQTTAHRARPNRRGKRRDMLS